jgi:hypothetical protein
MPILRCALLCDAVRAYIRAKLFRKIKKKSKKKFRIPPPSLRLRPDEKLRAELPRRGPLCFSLLLLLLQQKIITVELH